MWTQEQRGILKITVSGKEYLLDPMPLVRRYRAGAKKVGDEAFKKGIQMMLSGEETPGVADLIMPVIRDTLQWPAFNPEENTGHLESECLIAFTQFIEWLVESKKKDETLLSSAGSTGDSAETPPTPNTAASSSAETLSNPEGPGPQQSA